MTERSSRRRFLAASGALAATALAGCGSGGGADATATLTEWDVTLSTNSFSPGTRTFDVQNEGDQTHEFVVFRTDLAPDSLPVEDDTVNEDAGGLTLVEEKEDIESGDSASLDVDLVSGNYVAICNLPTHYGMGMYEGFTVSES